MNIFERLRESVTRIPFLDSGSSLRNLDTLIDEINSYKPTLEARSDEQLKELAANTSRKVCHGEQTLDEVMPQFIALIRESSKRTLGMFHYDEQVLAGLILSKGAIGEIATGEGKTLIATIPASVHALKHKGVHVVTVNSYLTERDCESTRDLYEFLGFSVSIVTEDDTPEQKILAYSKDITFGTGYQFGFDYLREQLRLLAKHNEPKGSTYRQKLLGRYTEPTDQATHKIADFVIVDEVDSVLLDEGHMPLVIAGSGDKPHPFPHLYTQAKLLASKLTSLDYRINPESLTIELTPEGKDRVYSAAQTLNLKGLKRPFHLYIQSALRADKILRRDTHYVVQNKKIAIVDENTGRRFEERTWKDGVHQAVQAKENIKITEESESLASISRQKYFNMYPIISGMTGTGAENMEEFKECFKLEFKKVPLHKPSQQKIYTPKIHHSWGMSIMSIIDEIQTIHAQGRPILIGTRTIQASEMLAEQLRRLNLKYALLNAKQDAEEAEIIKHAGEKGAITIATNMAGRGTHIDVSKSTQELGGLHVIVLEHQESARVDRQMIGRTARQGQPGSSQFFLSADDYIMVRYSPTIAMKMKKEASKETGLIDPKYASHFKETQVKIEKEHYYQRKSMLSQDKWIDSVKSKL